MSAPSVLYEAPGPRARQRNRVVAVVFVLVLVGLAWWVLDIMADKHQLDWAKWSPYLTDGESWTTYLLPGLKNTIIAAMLSIVIALPVGAVFGIARLSDHTWVRWPASVVVEFFRAVPVLLMMLFANEAYALFTDIDREIRPLYAVVTGLVLYNSSVLAEVVRAGIFALPRGQTEAAQAVGLRKGQLMANVLLPQAVTAMLPAIVSQLVVIVKDTAIGGAVLGYAELLNNAGTAANFYGANTIATMAVIAVIYIAMNFALTSFASWLERRMRRSKKSTGSVLGAGMVEEQAPGMAMTDQATGGEA